MLPKAALIGVVVLWMVVASQAQTISSVSPASGNVGTTVTITGTNFGATQSTSTVTFNGVAAAARGRVAVSWSNTSIVVTVPSGATTGNVVVTVAGHASNAVAFAVGTFITGLSPASGPVGTMVSVNGSGFGASQGSSTITFNGVTVTPSTWSNSSINVTVPSGTTTGNVVVTAGGVASNGMLFTAFPVISSLSSSTSAVGGQLTITGINFGPSPGTVTFNGTAATTRSWSTNSIVAQVPAGATTGNVVVTVAGNASNGMPLTISAAPLVQSNSGFAANATSIPLAFLSNNTAGNLLWVAVGSGGAITAPTDTLGNIYKLAASATGSAGSGNAAIYYAASAKAGANTVTCNQSSSADIHCQIAEITGFAPGARLDQTGSVASSSTCSVSTSGATNQANEWVGAFFYDGANNRTLTAGSGYTTLQLSNNGAADAGLSESHSVTSAAVQAATCAGNSSDALDQLITTFGTLQPAAIGLTSSTASSTYGSPVTLTATVSGNVGAPTGAVTFNDGTTTIGSTTVSAGAATFTTNVLGAGTHSITASYSGDANYVGAQSSSVSETVAQATTTIALTSSVTGTVTFGNPVTFTATVTPSAITGNVTFSDGSTALGSAPITNGQAVFTTSALAPGSHSITSSLAGTSNFTAATSTAVTTPVSLTGVTFTLNCVNGTTCGSSTYGDSVAINITVTGKPTLPVPTGTVNISDCAGHTVGPDVGLSAGSATVTTNTLTPDIKSICGVYSPDAASSKFYFNDQSGPLAWTVSQAATTTALKSDATTNPIVTGTTVTFTATVTGVPNGVTPTGNVTFNDTFNGSTTALGTANLANGTAALATSKLQDGVHSIAATYNGDKNYKTSTSSPLQQTLQTKPVVQSLSLIKGPPGIGLVVNGKNFGNGGATSKIEFKAADGTRTQLTLVGPGWTAQAITVQIPTALKLGLGTIVVTAPDPAGNPASSNELGFEVIDPVGCP